MAPLYIDKSNPVGKITFSRPQSGVLLPFRPQSDAPKHRPSIDVAVLKAWSHLTPYLIFNSLVFLQGAILFGM